MTDMLPGLKMGGFRIWSQIPFLLTEILASPEDAKPGSGRREIFPYGLRFMKSRSAGFTYVTNALRFQTALLCQYWHHIFLFNLSLQIDILEYFTTNGTNEDKTV